VFATVVATVRTSLVGRIALGALAGVWIALAALLTAAHFGGSPFVVPLMFALPLITVGLLGLLSPSFRAALSGIPSAYIIGINVFRVIGVLMLLAAAQGQLAGPFPYFAGTGDFITGLFAMQTARLAQDVPLNNPRILAWNAFGMLDLLLAVTLGILSQPNSPTQLIHAGVGSGLITTLPWSLIPLVLVPTFLIGHMVIFARALGQRQENAVTT
ncbi:MAG TPA: hypothetical protein VF741_05175, partial [Candidatus Aquilonibacter sp.]